MKTAAICNRLCQKLNILFFTSHFADYLNNLSPDSKEYEDTQGTAAEPSCVTRSQLVLGTADRNTRWMLAEILYLLTRRHSVGCKYLFFPSFFFRLPWPSVAVVAALVIVSAVADQANDNLKQGVSLRWTHSTFITFRPLGLQAASSCRIEKQARNRNSSLWGRNKKRNLLPLVRWKVLHQKCFPYPGNLHQLFLSFFPCLFDMHRLGGEKVSHKTLPLLVTFHKVEFIHRSYLSMNVLALWKTY